MWTSPQKRESVRLPCASEFGNPSCYIDCLKRGKIDGVEEAPASAASPFAERSSFDLPRVSAARCSGVLNSEEYSVPGLDLLTKERMRLAVEECELPLAASPVHAVTTSLVLRATIECDGKGRDQCRAAST